MFQLKSIDKNNYLEIEMFKIDRLDTYNWIYSRIKYVKNQTTILKRMGSYFNLSEIKVLLSDLKDLLEKKSESVESSFLEPNLHIRIDKKTDSFSIETVFKEGPYFDSKDKDDSSRSLKFITDEDNVRKFTKNLEQSLGLLKKS